MINRTAVLLCALLWAGPRLFSQAPAPPTIRKIEVRGNVRVPTATILHYISAAPEKPYNEAQVRSDLRRLYDVGMFQRVDIQTRDAEPGQIDLIYEVREQPVVSEFLIEGLGQAEQEQIQHQLKQEKLEVQPWTPFRPGAVNKTASFIRAYLRTHKHPLSEVRILTEDERPGTIRIRLAVQAGPELDVGEVQFSGNHSIPVRQLAAQLKFMHSAPFFMPWASGMVMAETTAADLENLRRYYMSKGFAAARIGKPEIVVRDFPRPYRIPLPKINGPKQKLSVLIPVVEGPVYRLESVKSEGGSQIAAAEMGALLAKIPAPSRYDYSLLDSTRQKMVDALGHYGYALAQVELAQDINDTEHTVAAVYRIRPGNPVAIGKIKFDGNTRVRDRFLRRELVPREGDVFDSAKLDRSIQRLNRVGIVQEIRRADVSLEMNDTTQQLDITFKVREKERQGIYGTGGTGGIGGGYLGVLYTAFDLLGLGESLSLQVDGGASQRNALLNIVGTRFLGLPFTLGLSVFHRLTNFNIASIVPDAADLVHLLKHRTTGAGLSGAYPISSKVQVGVAAQFEKLSLTETAVGGGVAQRKVQNRTELSPNFVFDSTQGTGPGIRGPRFAFTTSWAGTTLLRSVDSTAQSFRFSEYFGDPITGGRNSFAFRIQAAAMRPRNGVALTLDRRFYPGDEIVRGFNRGGLTPWAYGTGTNRPAPVGADTVFGISMEYRIPIQGPVSAAAFIDLGWSALSRNHVDQDTGSRLINETNRILRASVGGEFRVQLPVIRQPGRFIFSWNPLRLGSLLQGKSGLLQLADPRRTFHFALGDRF